MMSSRVVERSPRVPFPAVSLGCGRHEPAKRPGPRSGRCDRARWGCGRRGPQPRSATNAAPPCEEGVRPAATRRGTRPLTGSPSGSDRSNQRATPGMVVVFAHAIKDIGHCKRSSQTRPSAETTTDLARRLSSFNRSLISRRPRRRRLHRTAHPPCVAASPGRGSPKNESGFDNHRQVLADGTTVRPSAGNDVRCYRRRQRLAEEVRALCLLPADKAGRTGTPRQHDLARCLSQ
jgi:hypothetical protein